MSTHEPVGGVAEEAAKLLGALQGWAREASGDAAPGSADHAGSADSGDSGDHSGHGSLRDHLATGAPECTYCPLCRAIAGLRATSPEVREHLTTAASALLQAGLGWLGTTPPHDDDAGSDPATDPRVQRIDLSDDESWENGQ